MFAVTATDVEPADADDTDQLDTFNVNDGVTTVVPGCDTCTVRDTCGEPLVDKNVTVALREDVAVFA